MLRRGAGRRVLGKIFTTSSAGRSVREARLSVSSKSGQDQHRDGDQQVPSSSAASSSSSPTTPYENKTQRDSISRFFPVAPSIEAGQRHRTQYNNDPFSLTPSEEHYTFPLVTASDLAKSESRPRKVRMLARDFIDDSLYNPHYGYFSRHAVLLPDGAKQVRSYDFRNLSSDRDFMAAVEGRYTEFEETLRLNDEEGKKLDREKKEDQEKRELAFTGKGLEAAQRRGKLDAARQAQSEKEAGEHNRDVKAMAARQVWHTPTELFKPYYAHAIARYILERYLEDEDGKGPLRIYEVGAGSGALAADVIGYIAENHKDIYREMVYTIIEISPRLARQQEGVLRTHLQLGRAQVVNKSIFEYDAVEKENCFFIALEVLDNLAHDVVRYSTSTLEPYQALVSIDEGGDMHELWEPVQDERIKRYLSLVGSTQESSGSKAVTAPAYLPWLPQGMRSVLTNHLPFYPNLTKPHYIPTGSLQLLDILAERFPKHRAIISDFDRLPNAIEGVNAPVVQTRLEGTMIPVTKYTVQQGFFDIFFPTNFKQLQHAHSQIVSKCSSSSISSSPAVIMDHGEFLEQYADTASTQCKDGSNPMLTWYANASWFLS